MKLIYIIGTTDLLISLAVLSIGLFVLSKNWRRLVNRVFALNVFCLALWIITASLSDLSPNNDVALFWLRLAIVGPFFWGPAFYYFSLVFPRAEKPVSKLKVFLIFLPVLALMPLIPTEYNVKSAHLEFWGANFEAGILYTLILVYLIAYLGGGIFHLIRKYRKNSNYHLQVVYVSLAMALVFIFGAISNVILPVFFDFPQLSSMGPSVALLIFSLITAYAILAQHFLDIRVVIRLGTVFGTLFTIIAAFYFFATTLLSQFFKGPFSTLSTLLPAFIIVLTYTPLKKAIENLTDRIFFQKKYRFNEIVNSFGESIHNAGPDLKEILKIFDNTITSTLKIKTSAIALSPAGKEFSFLEPVAAASNLNVVKLSPNSSLLKYFKLNPHTVVEREGLRRILESEGGNSDLIEKEVLAELEKTDFDIAVPIELSKGDTLIYLAGSKKSNDTFYSDDLGLLKHTANEIAPFIENAGLFEDLKITSEAKSRFISVVSHQLRTPISVIRWSLEMMREKDLTPKDKETFLDDSYQGAIFLGEQLDDILIALDIYDQKIYIKKEPSSLNGIFKDLVPEFATIVKTKKINLQYDIAPAADIVKADERKLSKMLKILLKNAIIYSANGGTIRIAAKIGYQDNKQRVVISISDNGIGITEMEREHIFEEFFRSDTARTMLPNGLGLGMFIAQAFAMAHGGQIWFYSEGRDKGVDFHIALPLE